MEIETFVTKDSFKSLAGCIALVEAATQALKLLIGSLLNPYCLWVAFIFSVLVSVVRLILSEKVDRESIILSAVNVIVIFLGAVGTYQVGIKPIEKLLM